MGAPNIIAVIYVTEVIQDMSELVKGISAGPSGDCRTDIMGDSQPCTMPKLRSGIVTGKKERFVSN